VLPVAEIDFREMPRGLWRIVSYRSKWETGSEEDLGTIPSCPADLPPELTAELADLALAAWRTVGGEGYGRVDFRVDASGRPWLLEVNANPDLSPSAGLARMARAADLDFGALVRRVADWAMMTPRAIPTLDAELWALTQRLSGVSGG
jgi:D-alanine-D-alanine ligase